MGYNLIVSGDMGKIPEPVCKAVTTPYCEVVDFEVVFCNISVLTYLNAAEVPQPIGLSFCRDFSRFSEDWPGSVVVGFGSVTVSSVVCRLETTQLRCEARVRAPCPRLLYSVQDRSM